LADAGIGVTEDTGGGANMGGCAWVGAGGVGPCTDIAAGGRWGVRVDMEGMGVERGGGGEAGLEAQMRDTDWGLEGGRLGDSWVRLVKGSDVGGAGVVKKDMGELKIPAEEGGGPSAGLGVMGGGPPKVKLGLLARPGCTLGVAGPPRKLSSSAEATTGRVAVTPNESARLNCPPEASRGLAGGFLVDIVGL